MLPDGSYDVFVVDLAPLAEGEGWSLELTILGGDHKGDVVTVAAEGLDADELDLLGTPGTLVVADGTPSVNLEP